MRNLAILTVLFAALPLPAREPLERASVTVEKDRVDFLVGKTLVTRYHIGANVAKPYFWPLNGPGGVALTRGWPMEKGLPNETTDHVHQKSAWFCHGDVIPEGLQLMSKVKGVEGVDFWSETAGHGRIVCTKVGEPKSDKNHAWIPSHNEWRTYEGFKILDEARVLHFYDYGETRLLVLEIDFEAKDFPITFGDTKEGSLGIRINDSIREEITVDKKRAKGPGNLENAQGKVGEKDCWGHLSDWCDYSGPLGDKTIGLTIFSDPKNPHPACWHSRGYGLMAANPFGRAKSGFPEMKGKNELVKLAKGEHLKLRFGLLLHPGNAKDGKVAEYFDRFVKQ